MMRKIEVLKRILELKADSASAASKEELAAAKDGSNPGNRRLLDTCLP